MNVRINPVLESCAWVMEQAKLVKIDAQQVKKKANEMMEKGLQKPDWSDAGYMKFESEDERAQYSMVLESQNWGSWYGDGGQEPERWVISYQGKEHQGWYGVVTAVKRAIEEDVPILEADFLANVSETEMEQIFRTVSGDARVAERTKVFNSVGKSLIQKHEGQIINLLNECGFDSLKIIERLANDFEFFNDAVNYQGREIKFYKHAQHFALMLYGLLEKKVKGIENLTVLSDYKVPQIFRYWGVLVYEDKLASKVDSWEVLEKDSMEEVEIRAGTVVTGDLLHQELLKLGSDLKACELDVNLWLMSSAMQNGNRMKPHHLVKTNAY